MKLDLFFFLDYYKMITKKKIYNCNIKYKIKKEGQ